MTSDNVLSYKKEIHTVLKSILTLQTMIHKIDE